jgi:hypothetical protein
LNAPDLSRRGLLTRLALATPLAIPGALPLAASFASALGGSLASLTPSQARAADAAPLLAESDPEAKAIKYVDDTAKSKEAMGNRCDTCSLYQGANGTAQGACQIIKGKVVKAAGWCNAWAAQI